tara:strand:- start:58 stop:498 length:441 start_codon:yes stop_codon:yes gene_type:complete
MKKIITTLILTAIVSVAFAQSTVQTTCYTKYAKVFEKRGAKAVTDGTYDDIIITIRKGSMADCFYGKVTIKDDEVDYQNMYLKFEDGTYEKLDLTFKNEKKSIRIVNGISNTFVTEDEELVNVLFVKNIKPKKKKYAKAAEPDFDL